MNERDRLIELIKHCTSCEECRDEDIADHLLANGVIVSPVKVGQTVWTIWCKEVHKAKVILLRPFVSERCVEYRGNVTMTIEDPFFVDKRVTVHSAFIIFGKDTFLTREEAEQALAERQQK